MLIPLNTASKVPLYQQVFTALRQAIVQRELAGGEQLPPSRELAHTLALSRNTINTAYDMLCAEGYVSAKRGSGYYVSPDLPDSGINFDVNGNQPKSTTSQLVFSKRGQYLARPTRPVPSTLNPAFQPGLPDLAEFPFHLWRRCVNQSLKTGDIGLYKYSDQGGYRPLKKALRDYLAQSRGVKCTAEQIVIVNGSQAGLDLITRLLIDDGDNIAIEEPGYLGARDGFLAAGATLVPVPVDDEGLDVNLLKRSRKKIRLVYTTPSYQFPLGVTMSSARRLALLTWAEQKNAFIIEDDYDSEYRYRGRPLSSLQGLDAGERVIYFGTFSKVMFPGLRMGYLVVPPSLAEGFAKALRKTGQDTPLQLQAAVTTFIEQGYFASHIRRMRTLYGEKQRLLVEAMQTHLADVFDIQATEAGMQLPVFYKRNINERNLVNKAKEMGLTLTPLANYHLNQPTRPGLYLGYAGVPKNGIKKAVQQLQSLL